MDFSSDDVEEDLFLEEKIGPYSLWLHVAEDDFNVNKKTLFATMIWHGSRALSKHMASDVPHLIRGKLVLEFGAGAGLPSLTCHKIGASIITSSDYPAPSVILNLCNNAVRNILNGQFSDTNLSVSSSSCTSDSKHDEITSNNLYQLQKSNFYVVEHTWGEDVSSLLHPLSGKLYDVIIASECLWKSDTHEDFITSINNVLKPGGIALLSFSHHIPGLESVDLKFFEMLKRKKFSVTSIKEVIVPHMWSDRSASVYIYEILKCL